MDIAQPTSTVFWVASAGAVWLAGVTAPDQVTTFGPAWTLSLQTEDEAEWLEECGRLGIAAPEHGGP